MGGFGCQDLEVFYREAKPPEASPHVSVLLLHGMAFTSETWQNLGTIGTLAQMGYRVVAVDIPGGLLPNYCKIR